VNVSCSLKPFLKSLIVLCFGLLASVPAKATIEYTVSLEHPEKHLFRVAMKVPDVHGELTVQMAAWNALYQIRDFSEHVQEVQAFVGETRANIEKLDKQTWRIRTNGTVTIRYATYWDEAGPFASQLNGEHAFINPAMILLYVPERRGEDIRMVLANPPEGWRAETSAGIQAKTADGARTFEIASSSFDSLADSPIEAGKFEEFPLSGINPPVNVVVHGESWSKKRIEDDLKRICQYEVKLMDGAPYEHYTFIVHIGKGAGGGGMEHANSTAIGVYSDEYLPGVAAHEFFHLWNVKRIRPASLEPIDYTKEQFTRALWFAEGVTSTYGSYTLVRSGIWSKERFYDDLGAQITELEGRPANQWQSAEQSSLDAWLEKYPLYNQAENSVSYYTKGQVLGDLLDILIRDRTGNTKSLDDVLRAMNTDFAKRGKPYRDSFDVRLTAEKVAGGSLEEFFQKYVAGTEPFPYQEVLALAGWELRTSIRKRATLGFSLTRDANGTILVASVEGESNALQAGLRAGDAIVSWNGGDVPRRPQRWVADQASGDVVKLRIRRDEKESALEFRLGEVKETFYQVAESPQASEKARLIREGLLRGETSRAAVN